MTARMLVHQVRYEQRVFWRNRSGVFFTFVFPLLLLIFLAANTKHSYREFIVPGIAALALVGTSFQGFAIGLAIQRDAGILKRLRATPLSPTLLLTSKIFNLAVVVIFELICVTIFGWGVYRIGWPQDPLLLI